MEQLIINCLTQLGLGVAANAVYGGIKNIIGKKVKREEIIKLLESIEALDGRVEEVLDLLKVNNVLAFDEKGLIEVAGTHEAHGIGNITGLDIQGPARIKPGTISKASGIGNVTGTRIGGQK